MLVGGFSHPDPLLSRDAKQAVQHLALKKEKKKDKSMQIEKKENCELLSPPLIKTQTAAGIPQFEHRSAPGVERARVIGMSAVLRRFSPSANQLVVI